MICQTVKKRIGPKTDLIKVFYENKTYIYIVQKKNTFIEKVFAYPLS